MANVVMGAAGAVVGFFVGGPAGAAYGFALGYGFGTVLGNLMPEMQGPKIGDVATQTSREGVPRPIVYGVARPIAGNIIFCGKPVIRTRTTGGGGKGGGGKKQKEERVYRSYAIRICEGPVNGIRRVWRDNKLVYDALAEVGSTQEENNTEFLKKATFYHGEWDQMPDPTIEAELGVGEVPAYRGTCYMVMDMEDLTDRRGGVPQFVFEVVRSEGFILTSQPYPVETVDTMDVGALIGGGSLQTLLKVYDNWAPEYMDVGGAIDAGSLMSEVIYDSYDNWEAEYMDVGGKINAGSITQLVIYSTYNDWPPEYMDVGGKINDGSLTQLVAYLTYEDWPPEYMDVAGSINGGSLTTV